MRNVVVTGMGTINPIGCSVAETWDNALKGATGIGSIKGDWDPDLPVKVAGYTRQDPSEFLTYSEARRLDRAQQMALIAFREAWQDANLTNFDPTRVSVSIGAGSPGAATFKLGHDLIREKGIMRLPPYIIPMTMPNGPTALLAMASGARGSAQTLVSACASGADAIANAFRLIKFDSADVVICGGTESPILEFTAAGFCAMRALSTQVDPNKASRPFDANRDGFVLAEGSAVLILESEDHALNRGARVYGKILGESVTSEGHHVVAPSPDGDGPRRTMAAALSSAGVSPEEVGYINAHATSTVLGDLAESEAITTLFKKNTDNIIVSATKSMTGHLIGASGALEAILTVKSLDSGHVPPSINITEQDPGIGLRVSSQNDSVVQEGTVAVSNSFAFGGHNVSLVLA